jgi:hypothetical protein
VTALIANVDRAGRHVNRIRGFLLVASGFAGFVASAAIQSTAAEWGVDQIGLPLAQMIVTSVAGAAGISVGFLLALLLRRLVVGRLERRLAALPSENSIEVLGALCDGRQNDAPKIARALLSSARSRRGLETPVYLLPIPSQRAPVDARSLPRPAPEPPEARFR